MSDLYEQLETRLSLLVPVNKLTRGQQEEILKTAEILELRRKEYVFRQGARDRYSFYVLDGEVQMYADDQLIKQVVGGEGSSFQALGQLIPRQMSAQAKTPLKILRIDRGLLDKFLAVAGNPAKHSAAPIEVAEIEASESTDWLTAILQSELFSRIPPSNIQRMLDTIEPVKAKAGEVVVRQGAPGDYYYAVQRGTCAVTRTTSNRRELKLAELGPGDTFGEEALVSDATRNATVTMTTDGQLGRLTKKDFIDLITKPILATVSHEKALDLVAGGARWLDVRFPEEHAADGIAGSINIPISFLRARCEELSRETRYVVYCDTGGRSSAAAFLLAQRGFDVCYVEGGGITEHLDQPRSGAPQIAPPATPHAADDGDDTAGAIIEADSRAQSLSADLAKAKLQIQSAKRLIKEAEAAKREAERIVHEKLRVERDKLNRDAEKVHSALAEAQRLKKQLEAQQKAAATEAAQRHRDQEMQIAARQRQAETKLLEEKQRLEEVYRKQAERLEELQTEQLKAREELAEAWETLESESTHTRERLEAAKRLEFDVREKERLQALSLQEAERTLRAQLKNELADERKKLEVQFAETAREIERAQREKSAAENARRAAEEAARVIVEEYKAQQQNLIATHKLELASERRRLEQEADRIRAELVEVARARDAADEAKRHADRELEIARGKQPATAPSNTELQAEITAMEQRAHSASRQLREANAAKATIEDRQRENDERLGRSYNSKTEINILVQKELDAWLAEQERIQSATGPRLILEKQYAQTERIRAHVAQAQKETAAQTRALLDEIAEQLGD